MNINDLLIKDVMIMDLQATDKKARLMKWSKNYTMVRISDIDTYKEGILKREAQTSTGFRRRHRYASRKNSAVKEPTVLFAKSKKVLIMKH